jgi:multiple sugar transport system permease protein
MMIRKILFWFAAVMIAVWFLTPIVMIFVAAFTPAEDYYNPHKIFPSRLTFEHLYKLLFLLDGWKAIITSVEVALVAIGLSFLIGLPAGYAMARYRFRGKNFINLTILLTRSIPLIVVAVPLIVVYMRVGLSDTVLGVALAHTAMILPFVVLITSSIFSGISVEYEEAGMVFGLTHFQSFVRITLPLALPGLAASAIYSFIMSWNEVFVASILTLTRRTLPAHVLNTAMASPDYFKFAAGVMMAVPAMIFIFFTRKYLISMWGISLK